MLCAVEDSHVGIPGPVFAYGFGSALRHTNWCVGE